MAENQNDPPLAGKAKPSSLTEFEIKALKLQKEGKNEEVQKEIQAKKLVKEVPKEEPKQAVASTEDMRLYENIVQKVNNPIPLDQVPPKYRAQIEEGMALLKSIVEDKKLLEELKKAHDEAFKDKPAEQVLRAPILPDDLLPEVRLKESGDVSKIEAPIKEPAKEVKIEEKAEERPKTKEEKITFINDINSPAVENMRPSPMKTEEPKQKQTIEIDNDLAKLPDMQLLDACPHCGWDLKKHDPTEVSDEDKYDFVQSVLGNIRFKKRYELLGGKYVVVFRALTSKESDMAFRQIVIDGQRDLKNMAAGGQDFYWRNLQAYRMTMSLESITSESYGTMEIPTLDSADLKGMEGKDVQSKMPAFLEYVLDTFLPMDSVRAIVGHAYFEFQSVCDKLQVMAESPNFWKAIE